jgi:hypothetical protein
LETVVDFFRDGFGLVEEEDVVDDFFLGADVFLVVVELFLLLLLLFEEALVGAAAAGAVGLEEAAAAPDAPVAGAGAATGGAFPALGAPELDMMNRSRFHTRCVYTGTICYLYIYTWILFSRLPRTALNFTRSCKIINFFKTNHFFQNHPQNLEISYFQIRKMETAKRSVLFHFLCENFATLHWLAVRGSQSVVKV